MPARVVFVHDDPRFAAEVVAALNDAGHELAAYSDSLTAMDVLERSARTELLITRVRFASGLPHGISLALMARTKLLRLQVLFVEEERFREHADGIGEYLVQPVAIPDLLATVGRLLSTGPPPRNAICKPDE